MSAAKCLYLSEADVERLLNMKIAIDVVEEAFRRLSAGEAVNIPRARAQTPGVVLHTMSAAASYLGLAGWKCYTTTRQNARFHVGLYDQQSGDLVALIAANRLGQLRTGATTAVATEWMAAPKASELGLFGSGWQAETQLAAVAAVRPIKQVFVYSRQEDRRVAFAQRMSQRLGIDVQSVDRPQAAAEELPIVVTATTSRQPVLDGSWLADGALVCAVGSNWWNRAELDATTIRLAGTVVCDSVEACKSEAGDFAEVLERGIFDWKKAVDLAEVVAGRATARPRTGGIALFKSVGLAIEDVALGGKLLELARAAGVGTELPL